MCFRNPENISCTLALVVEIKADCFSTLHTHTDSMIQDVHQISTS